MAVDAIIGALIGFGASEVISGISSSSKKTASGPSQATLPSQTTADQTGQATVANQRAAMLAAGGQTDYTGGLGFITGADTSKSSLIGA